MKTIKDAVHDHIQIDELALKLLDTPEMQRLRHIKQLGTAYLVYPSANHTRFEHSIGVYYLANRALENLGVEGIEEKEVQVAALLHDIGHTPFSHSTENVIEEYIGKKHDQVDEILDGKIKEILKDEGIDIAKISDLIEGKRRLGQLISGELDVDRMDYLVRDAHHTGVPYGTVDSIRLALSTEFVDGDLTLREGNIQTAEALLLARALMHPTVYNHHVARISKAMLKKATHKLIESDSISAHEVRRMDDHEFFYKIRNNKQTRNIGKRLTHRRLYKRAIWEPFKNYNNKIDNREKLEKKIADKAKVSRQDVILDVEKPPEMIESGAKVVVDGEPKKLENVSRLVDTLRKYHEDAWNIGVYCPDKYLDRVKKASRKILNFNDRNCSLNP